MSEEPQPCYVHIRDLREGETVFRTVEMDDMPGLRIDVDDQYKLIGVKFDHFVDIEINGLSLRDDTSL